MKSHKNKRKRKDNIPQSKTKQKKKTILTVLLIILSLFCITALYVIVVNVFDEYIHPRKKPNNSSTNNAAEEFYLSIPDEEKTLYDVADCFDFSEIDFSAVSKVIIYSGITGETKEIKNDNIISDLSTLFSSLKGTDPTSMFGYYGSDYSITLFEGSNELLNFSLLPDNCISYGDYETIGKFTYGAMYSCSDTSAFDSCISYIDDLFN